MDDVVVYGYDGSVTTAVVAVARSHVTSAMFVNASSSSSAAVLADRIQQSPDAAGMHGAHAQATNILLGIVLSTFACVTVLGNVLVILAVVRERYLRSATNYFIVSLALADLVIGSVVMPFAISLEITEQYWLFGRDWCDVWHSCDVLASTASILNLSVIALDRYLAIMNPMKYPSRMTHSRILILIALVWILSSLISFPAILWWRAAAASDAEGKAATGVEATHTCIFPEDPIYLVLSSIISFYVPVIIILYAYYRIYRTASAQMRSFRTGTKVMTRAGRQGQTMTLRIHRGGRLQRLAQEAVACTQQTMNASSDDVTGQTPETLLSVERSDDAHSDSVSPSRLVNRKWQKFAISRKLSKIAKEQKAAKTLGIVMGIFCICWVPFFVANVLYGLCNTACVKHADVIMPVFTWLGYINSGMNPVIYACSMRDFRRAFSKILCCCFPAYKLKRLGGGGGGSRYGIVGNHTTATTVTTTDHGATAAASTCLTSSSSSPRPGSRQSQRSHVRLLVNGDLNVEAIALTSNGVQDRDSGSFYETISSDS